jgi:hypothetical protein
MGSRSQFEVPIIGNQSSQATGQLPGSQADHCIRVHTKPFGRETAPKGSRNQIGLPLLRRRPQVA